MATTIKVTARSRRAHYDPATNTARLVPPGGEGVIEDATFTVGRVPNPHTGQDDITVFPYFTINWDDAIVKVGTAPATVANWIETDVSPHEVQFLK